MYNLQSLLPLFPFQLPALSFPGLIFVFQYLFTPYLDRLSSLFPLQDCSHQTEQEHCLPFTDLGKAYFGQVFYKLCQSLYDIHFRHRQKRRIGSDHHLHTIASSKPLLRILVADLSHRIPLFHLLRSLAVGDYVAERTFAYRVNRYNSAAKQLVAVINLEVGSVADFAVGRLFY